MGQPALPPARGRGQIGRLHGQTRVPQVLCCAFKQGAMLLRVEGRIHAGAPVAFDEDDQHIPIDPVQKTAPCSEGIGTREVVESAQIGKGVTHKDSTLQPDASREGCAGRNERNRPARHDRSDICHRKAKRNKGRRSGRKLRRARQWKACPDPHRPPQTGGKGDHHGTNTKHGRKRRQQADRSPDQAKGCRDQGHVSDRVEATRKGREHAEIRRLQDNDQGQG